MLLLRAILVAIVVALLLRQNVAQAFALQYDCGESRQGDHVLVNRLARPEIGEAVVFEVDRFYCGTLVKRTGHRVAIRRAADRDLVRIDERAIVGTLWARLW